MTRKRFIKLLRSWGFPRNIIDSSIYTVTKSRGAVTYKRMWRQYCKLYSIARRESND